MSDLTPLFQQCVNIVTRELKSDVHQPKPKQPSYLVSDSFSKEAAELYSNLIRLAKFIIEVKSLYLQVNDELSYNNKDGKDSFTIDDKNSIDEKFKLKIQKVFEKLKYLQSYEKKRSEVASASTNKKGIMSIFTADASDPISSYFTALASHRMQIIRFLNETTQKVSTDFEEMQQKRYDRERQLNLLHFQNIDDSEDVANDFEGGFDSAFQFDVVEEDSQPNIQLTQQQIQELSSENSELLKMKTNQFKQVEKLQHSMVDIVKLQTELTMHLETQAEQIENILDNQDQVGVDLKLGNRTLAKATERNKRGSNLIITTCIVLGCLLLFVDYIS